MRKVSPNLILRMAVGFFFAIAGLYGLQGNISLFSDLQGAGSVFLEVSKGLSRFMGSNQTELINIILSALALAGGVLMVLTFFVGFRYRDSVYRVLWLIIVVVWLLRILFYFLNGNWAEPNFLLWMKNLCLDIIVLAALWSIRL